MALNGYTLRPPSTVILVDERDPYVSWQHHLDRTNGLRGGVDLVAAVGTPVYARTAGRMLQLWDDGTAGNSSRFAHLYNPGWQDVFSHLSSYRTPRNPQGLNAFDYEAGDIICYTGDTGGVAPHLHWHLLDPGNVRRNPWDYFSGAAPASIGTTPITEEHHLMTYSFVKDAKSATIWLQSLVTGDRVGIKSMYHYELLRRVRESNADDPMLASELDIVRGYLDALDNPDPALRADILAAIKAITINPDDVRAAVKAALAEGSFTIDATVSDEQLDAASTRFAKLLGIRVAGGSLGSN